MRAVLWGAGGGGAGPLRAPDLLPLLGADAGAVRGAVLRRVPGGAGPGGLWKEACILFNNTNQPAAA